MVSTYSTGLSTDLQVTGENSGTWGTITNNTFSQVFASILLPAATANCV